MQHAYVAISFVFYNLKKETIHFKILKKKKRFNAGKQIWLRTLAMPLKQYSARKNIGIL